jgi:hypothetical protein
MNIISYVNSFSLARTARFADPQILVRGLLLQLIVMHVEICVLFRQTVAVRNNVEWSMSKLFLHVNYVLTKIVFPCDLITSREMVHFLILIETFIYVGVGTVGHPQDVPVVRLCHPEPVNF